MYLVATCGNSVSQLYQTKSRLPITPFLLSSTCDCETMFLSTEGTSQRQKDGEHFHGRTETRTGNRTVETIPVALDSIPILITATPPPLRSITKSASALAYVTLTRGPGSYAVAPRRRFRGLETLTPRPCVCCPSGCGYVVKILHLETQDLGRLVPRAQRHNNDAKQSRRK